MTGDITGYWPPDGMYFADYMQQNLVITNADIQGMEQGIEMPLVGNGATTVENSYLMNQTNIYISTMCSTNGAVLPARSQIINNVQFAAPAGDPLVAIQMDYEPDPGGTATNLIQLDQTYVYNYNQSSGDNFQVYYSQQVPSNILLQSNGSMIGSPVSGLTNQQNWNTYGICIAGAIAPSNATTMAAISGGLIVALPVSATPADAVVKRSAPSESILAVAEGQTSSSGLMSTAFEPSTPRNFRTVSRPAASV